jgi:SAM-dependent methyltransferase
MREAIKDLVKTVRENLPIYEPILEFGSLQVPGQEVFADLRHLFQGKKYIGCDIRKGPGVDRILDLHKIDLPNESIGTVLILDTLEHVEYPRKGLEEVYRILKPNGLVVVSSVLNFPIHEHPHDYWRFTPDGFKSLLKDFSQSYVDFAGDPLFPRTIVGLGVKDSEFQLKEHINIFEQWKNKWERVPLWKSVIKSVTPPIILNIFKKY